MTMLSFVGLLLCVNYVVGSLRGLSPEIEADVEKAFHSYVKNYGKQYASKDEHEMRKATFLKNWKMIEHHNRQNLSYTMKVNQFADRTDKELSTGALPLPSPLKDVMAFPYSSEDIQNLTKFLPKNFDMRREGYVSSVKDQGSCGSCWAFSVAGVVEAALTRKRGGRTIDLSEQALVDCVPSPGGESGGCHGNYIDDALEYVKKNGIPTEEEYPYEAETGSCRAKYMVTTHKIKGYMQPTPNDPEALKVALYFHGPVAVQMHLSRNLKFIDRGIFYEAECNSGGLKSRDHALIVVGYGNREGVDYWILKNSHGTDWGKDGYALISAKDDDCFITTHPWIPIVTSGKITV